MKKIVVFFLLCHYSFSQSNSSFTEKIYRSIDVFVSHPNIQSIESLNKIEQEFDTSKLPKTNADFLALVILYCNKAYYLNTFGQTHQAITAYEKAWLLFQSKKLRNYDITEYCLKPLGNLYTITNDFDSAENTIKQYYFVAHKSNDTNQKISAILNLSNVYQSSGKSDLAIDLLLKTLQQENTNSLQKGNLYNNLGTNYFAKGAYSNAQEAFQKSIQLLATYPNSETLCNAYRNLSKIYALREDYKMATHYFEKSKALFLKSSSTKNPREIAKFYYEKALLLFQQKDYINAKNNIQNIYTTLIPNYNKKISPFPNGKSLYPETVLLDALDLQADLFRQEKKDIEALKAFTLAFRIEDLIQTVLVTENSKIINQIRNRNRSEKCIEIYYSLYEKEKKTLHAQNAFALCEETKSAVIKAVLLHKNQKTNQEKKIISTLQDCNTAILNEQSKGEAAKITILNDLIKRQNELTLALKSIQKKEAYANNSMTIAPLFKKTNKEEVTLISYFFGTKNVYSFTVFNAQLQFIKLGESVIYKPVFEKFISCFNQSEIINNDVAAYQKAGLLAHSLLRIPATKTKNLVIIPDGILNFVPFEALITKEKKTLLFEKMDYLMTHYSISYCHSVSFFLQDAKSVANPTVLGIFPIFENSDLELPFSRTELAYLKENFKGNYLEKEKATYANFKKKASQFSILHLSTHATGGDAYDAAQIRFYDNPIYYSQLYNLDINPDLVVLSACETGLGKWYKGEGAMSVARGFQMAGATNLLFSLWKVNDFSTAIYMRDFYHRIQNGEPYNQANQLAKMDYLHDPSISNSKKSPYYWSAFVYYGAIQQPKTNYFYYSAIGVFTILILFVLRYRMSKKSKK